MQDFDLIETPENVELQRRLAGIGTRFIAGILDHLLIFLIFFVLILLLAFSGIAVLNVGGATEEAQMWVIAAFILFGFAIYWGYFVFFELRTNGQTPGKKHMRIRVVKEGGSAITFTDAAIRNLLRAVDAVPLYGAGGICMFLTRKMQRLGDLAAGTVVISEQAPDYAARADKSRGNMQWGREASPPALRATGLTPQEYTVLLNYWTRRNELTPEARQRILPTILRPILERTGETLPNQRVFAMESYVERMVNTARLAELEAAHAPPTEQHP